MAIRFFLPFSPETIIMHDLGIFNFFEKRETSSELALPSMEGR